MCNLHDLQSVLSAVSELKPNGIVHFAGTLQPANASNKINHHKILDNNLRIDSNVIRAAVELEIPNFLCVSSISAYGEWANLPFEEKNLYSGPPPSSYFGYGVSKRLTIDLIKAVNRQTGMNYKCALLGNVYGPHGIYGASATVVGNLIDKIHKAKTAGKDLSLWGTGQELRSLTYVGDLKDIFEKIMQNSRVIDFINVGNPKTVSVSCLAKEIADIMKYSKKIYFTGSEYGKNKSRYPDSRQFRELFGDYPFTTLNRGLEITVNDFYDVLNEVENPNYGYTKEV